MTEVGCLNLQRISPSATVNANKPIRTSECYSKETDQSATSKEPIRVLQAKNQSGCCKQRTDQGGSSWNKKKYDSLKLTLFKESTFGI